MHHESVFGIRSRCADRQFHTEHVDADKETGSCSDDCSDMCSRHEGIFHRPLRSTRTRICFFFLGMPSAGIWTGQNRFAESVLMACSYACSNVHTHVYIHVYMHISTLDLDDARVSEMHENSQFVVEDTVHITKHMHTCLCTCLCTCPHLNVQGCAQVHAHVYKHVHAHAQSHLHPHVYPHVFIDMHGLVAIPYRSRRLRSVLVARDRSTTCTCTDKQMRLNM